MAARVGRGKQTRYFIGSSEYGSKADAMAKARAYAKRDGRPVTITVEVRERTGFERLLRKSTITVGPSKRNPPSGFIPCKAVKIERKNGGVVVRVRR